MATVEDAVGISEIHREMPGAWSLDSYKEELGEENSVSRRIYFVAEKSDEVLGNECDAKSEILGFAGMRLLFGEGEITNVAVKEEFRRKSIGERVFSELIEYAFNNGCDVIRLEVRKSNFAAIGLYRKLGFTEESIRKSYYDDGEDALILWRKKNGQ